MKIYGVKLGVLIATLAIATPSWAIEVARVNKLLPLITNYMIFYNSGVATSANGIVHTVAVNATDIQDDQSGHMRMGLFAFGMQPSLGIVKTRVSAVATLDVPGGKAFQQIQVFDANNNEVPNLGSCSSVDNKCYLGLWQTNTADGAGHEILDHAVPTGTYSILIRDASGVPVAKMKFDYFN